jgi:hypothetical protein
MCGGDSNPLSIRPKAASKTAQNRGVDLPYCPTDDWRHFLAEVCHEIVANSSVFAKLLKHERIILLSLYDSY